MVTGRTLIGDGEQPEIDVAERAVREVAAHKDAWATLPLSEKAALLAAVQRRLEEHAAEWIETVERARQLSPPSPWHGEEWYEVYTVAAALSAYRDTLEKLVQGRSPLGRN